MLNKDKFKTAEDRVGAFRKFCNPIVENCQKACKMGDADKFGGVDPMKCFSNWLELEAEDEKPEPCPFCRRETMSELLDGGFYVTCDCGYTGQFADTEAAAIAAHNSVARAVMQAKKNEVK